MNIPFVKAHGALNDFLLTWATDVSESADLPEIARAICHRNSGIGADGWMLVRQGAERLQLMGLPAFHPSRLRQVSIPGTRVK